MKIKEAKKYLNLPECTPLESLLISLDTDFDITFGHSEEGSKRNRYKQFMLDRIECLLRPFLNTICDEDYVAMEENILKAEKAHHEYLIKCLKDIYKKIDNKKLKKEFQKCISEYFNTEVKIEDL